jgi:hypothetical protein
VVDPASLARPCHHVSVSWTEVDKVIHPDLFKTEKTKPRRSKSRTLLFIFPRKSPEIVLLYMMPIGNSVKVVV